MEPSSTHPPLPPTTEDDRLCRLRLLRSPRVGPITFARLLREHGSAKAALRALPGIARAAGAEGYAPCPEADALTELRRGEALGARLLVLGHAPYPDLLARIADPPPLLWAMGDAGFLARPLVAMVGARNASSLGLRMARALAEGLGAEGVVIASGLARGVDAAAHRAALPTGTVAVLAGGLDRPYPPENEGLAAEVAARGLLLSEQPFGQAPQARHFPARNRIVAGLALATVVVEAAERSGSLITARAAAEGGREVMAVPGHPLDPRAGGSNLLLREGATLVRSAADVLEALAGALAPPRRARGRSADPMPAPEPPRAAGPGDLRGRILSALGPTPLAEDQLIRDLGVGAAGVAPVLMDLEIEGRVQRHPGGLLALVA